MQFSISRIKNVPPLLHVIAMGLLFVSAAHAVEADPPALTLYFDKPASDWEREGLPLGNGALGIVVMGGVERDRLQFNEKSLWEGGPGAEEGYHFGRPANDFPQKLAAIQQTLLEKGSMKPEAVAGVLGQPMTGYGHYQSFGNLDVEFHNPGPVSEYRRSLDLESALAQVSFRAGEVQYQREYFVSYPQQVIVNRFTASEAGKINFKLGFSADPNRSLEFQTEQGANNLGILRVRGALNNNGLRFQSDIAILSEGGKIEIKNNEILVSEANSADIFVAAGTNYTPEYPHYRGPHPAARVEKTIERALALGYEKLRENHLQDYQALFQRVKLDLVSQNPELSVDKLLASYGKGSAQFDRHLETLLFQFGRYLLIASSRAGSLPANLQGVWNHSTRPPWNADYHVNINLQMNYWPALSTNLSETAEPLYAFIESLRPSAEDTARIMGINQGWTLFLNTNIYGYTGLIEWPTAFWQPEAAAWLCRLVYDHYLFTGDEKFLRERAYPLMKGTTQYWLASLRQNANGEWLVVPSFSPEHGDFGVGAAMSQQIVSELLNNTALLADKFGDKKLQHAIQAKLKKLDRGLRIGHWGQLQEWREDLDDPENQHRHVSHLYALHPGLTINPSTTPELAAAARTSLNARGDGGTGWSKAWKINMWARLRDGDRAHRLFAEQIKHSTLPNLWDNHPPFQIDGNFGASAGVAELLLQSRFAPDKNRVELALLPALPAAWPDGEVQGLLARGGFTVNLSWQKNRLIHAKIQSAFVRDLKIETLQGCDNLRVVTKNKKPVKVSCKAGWLSFRTRKNTDYEIRIDSFE